MQGVSQGPRQKEKDGKEGIILHLVKKVLSTANELVCISSEMTE